MTIQATASAAIDEDLRDLTDGAAQWAALDHHGRIDLLRATHRSVAASATEWVRAAVVAKQIPAGPLEGEEWLAGPYALVTWLSTAIASLEALAEGRSPLADTVSGSRAGRTTFRVLPSNLYERGLFSGFTAEVWLRAGIDAEQARAAAGLGAARLRENGGVGLVLGAGNVSSIGPLDVLYELVAFNRASVLKLNPTFDGLTDVYRAALAPLIEANVLRIVNGGAEVGSYLTSHDTVDHVHITGSGATHDLIVWGSTTDKSSQQLTKPISSELGGVSPIIVIPGNWSKRDLQFQAEHVATQRLNNAGHNCIAGQLLILSSDWAQKQQFLDLVREQLRAAPERPTWYPRSDQKVAAATTSYPQAEQLGSRLLVRVDDTTSQDLLTTEYFAPVLGHTEIPGNGAEFFSAAVAFANDRLDGSLGAGVIVAPADRKAIAEFDSILGDLRYGTVGINVWSAMGFLLPAAAWGAYPGNTVDDVGSGIGVVHNAWFIDEVEKTVVFGPFRPFPRSVRHGEFAFSPRPPWFITNRRSQQISRRVTEFSAEPDVRKLPSILYHSIRG